MFQGLVISGNIASSIVLLAIGSAAQLVATTSNLGKIPLVAVIHRRVGNIAPPNND
jgi:hypothetical protein